MTSAFFLGVDGGGTKTRFALMDGDRKLVGEAQLGTSYHPDVGLDGVRAVLAQGMAQSAGRRRHRCIADRLRVLRAALPTARTAPSRRYWMHCPRPILGHDRYACDNDMVCGWAGSLGAEDGINIVAGTGSIGYGQRRGRSARAGGWGEAFSDEGSAYWIAMQGLNAYSRMSDGRLPKGPLHTLINESLKLENDLDLCAQVYGANARYARRAGAVLAARCEGRGAG